MLEAKRHAAWLAAHESMSAGAGTPAEEEVLHDGIQIFHIDDM